MDQTIGMAGVISKTPQVTQVPGSITQAARDFPHLLCLGIAREIQREAMQIAWIDRQIHHRSAINVGRGVRRGGIKGSPQVIKPRSLDRILREMRRWVAVNEHVFNALPASGAKSKRP
jgi:hypothetical protein